MSSRLQQSLAAAAGCAVWTGVLLKPGLAQQWEPAINREAQPSRTTLQWQPTTTTETTAIQWERVSPGQELKPVTAVETVYQTREESTAATPTPPKPTPTGAHPSPITPPTFGGFRDLFRGDRWYPSISAIVPMGFGPQGFMAGVGFSGADCKPESKTCINYPNPSLESIQAVGEAVIDSYLGFGDSNKAIGVLVTQMTQNTIRAAQDGDYFNGNQTGFAISRNLGPNTAIKLGAEGVIRWGGSRNLYADLPKSAFGVISTRIPLKKWTPESERDGINWFPEVYLTAGAGNGAFRPSDAIISAQIQSAKDAGCWFTACSPEKTRDAYLRGTEWGAFYPIGSIALAVTDQANLITEWTGRNLNISISWQPIREWGFTITPGIGNLIQNSDYGKNVNIPACPSCDMGTAITTRPIWYLRSMINIKF